MAAAESSTNPNLSKLSYESGVSQPAVKEFFNILEDTIGAEVDCVIDLGTLVIPLEIKSSAFVTQSEIKGLKSFLHDYHKIARKGYVITMEGIGRKCLPII